MGINQGKECFIHGYCSYTEQSRRPLTLQVHSSSMDEGHSIAMERQACPSTSSAMVHCKGIEHCPYFTNWNDTLIFFFTPSRSHPFIFGVLQMYHSIPTRVYQHRYICTYIYTYRERETDQNNKHFIIHYPVFYKHYFFTLNCHHRPFFTTLYCVSALLWDSFFLLFSDWHYFGFNLRVFLILGGRRTNTSKTIFLLVIKFIKTHGVQLLILCVTLSLDRCKGLHWVKIAPVPWLQVTGEVSVWTIPYWPKSLLQSLTIHLLPWFVGLQTKPGD